MDRLDLDGTPIALTMAGRGAAPLRANYGHHVGDDPELVRNRRLALAAELGAPILWMNQTHSAVVALVRNDSGPRLLIGSDEAALDPLDPMTNIEADGVVVDARGWAGAPGCAVLTADCLPVLLSAADGRVVAAVHAGRRGLLDGILTEAVGVIRSLDPDARIGAYIAPAICGCCYEVPESMRAESESLRPGIGAETSWGTPSLDLAKAAADELHGAGCAAVFIDERCTLENVEIHSFRRDPACGRNASVIVPRG